jgi:hypothetical protein
MRNLDIRQLAAVRYAYGGGNAFDPDYQAVLDFWNANGITHPSDSVKAKQNALIISLKNAEIWATRDSFSVVGETADQSLTDMKRLVQMSAVNSPGFISMQGFLGNGTTSYINTNYNPNTDAVNYALNNASVGVFDTSINNLASRVDIGSGNATSRIRVQPFVSGFATIQANDIGFGASNLATPTPPAYIAMNRLSSGQRHTFVNSLKSTVQNTPSIAIQSLNLFLLADNTGIPSFFSNSRIAMHHAGAGMTDLQHSSFYTFMQTYLS